VVYSGVQSAKISISNPSAGLRHSIGSANQGLWKSRVYSGKACIHYTKEGGTSAFFSEPILFINSTETSIRNIQALRLDNGDLIELFSASSTPEYNNIGGVYFKRNNGASELFLNDDTVKTWIWPGVIDFGNKYTAVHMKLDYSGVMTLHGVDLDRNFATQTNNRLLFSLNSTNVQAYNFIILSSGRVVIPIVYAAINQVSSGPWYLDVLYSDDNLSTVNRLNSPKTISGRGLMEAQPVLLSSGNIAILCRTSLGYLAVATYNPNLNTLSGASLTDICQPQSGSYAKNLSNGDIMLVWNTAEEESASSSYPRKIIAMAISSDDMATWHSYHVIGTSESVGDGMVHQSPYIHQPFVYEDNGTLIAYFERVVNSVTISLYKTIGSNYIINNVVNELKSWKDLIFRNPPESTQYVELLSIIHKDGIVYFDAVESDEIPNAPILSVDSTEIDFGSDTDSLAVSLSNTGNGVLSWSISGLESWLSVSPTSGDILSTTENLLITVNRTGLEIGNYSTTLIITSDVGNSEINISMEVIENISNSLLTGLVSLWNLDETAGDIAYDVINGANMTIGSAVLKDQSAPLNITKSFYFNSQLNSNCLTSLNAIPNSNQASISLWFKSSDTSGANLNSLFSIEGGWQINLTGTNTANFQVSFKGSFTGVTGLGPYNDGQWHHVLATNDGTSTKVYVDGASVLTEAQALYSLDNVSRTSAIGSRYDGSVQYMTTAYISQVAVWNVVKNVEDAILLYNSGNGLHSDNWN